MSRTECNDDDVLFSGDKTQGMVFSHHPGNKRFRVVISKYGIAYADALDRNDEHAKTYIVEMIVDSICRRCIPTGRFLEVADQGLPFQIKNNPCKQKKQGQWLDLGDGEVARQRITHVLNSMFYYCPQEVSQGIQPKENVENRVRFAGNLTTQRPIGEMKRRSISTLIGKTSTSSLPDKKLLANEDLSRFDVLCSSRYGGGILRSSRFVGNNRFRVIVSLYRPKFLEIDKRGRFEIVREIVTNLKSCSPPGRFLAKDESVNLWRPVSKKMMVASIIQAMNITNRKINRKRIRRSSLGSNSNVKGNNRETKSVESVILNTSDNLFGNL
mmetsp:Transcript_50975/g.75636  ORF Transcript_50975/g.75636 Transcript_50975/m.75636 type:complete len:327 (-) Transcript_50975:378-1358(-)